MHYSHTRWIIRIVILLLFTTILPFQSSELLAQRSGSSKSATKNKSNSKKSSGKRKNLAQERKVNQKRNLSLRKRNLQNPILKQKSILIEVRKD